MTHLPPPQPGTQQSAWQQAQQPQLGQPQQLAQPSWAAAPVATSQPRGNPLGVVALIVAAVAAVLLGVVGLVAQAVAIQGDTPQAIGAISAAMSVTRLVVALVGTALAVIGLVQRDRRRTIAAIALGANAAIAASILVGFLNYPIFALLG